jgi:hypothetical protein
MASSFTRFLDHTPNDMPQSVGLIWTSDQLIAETSTWQHTTHTTDKHPCPSGIRTRDCSRWAALDLRLRLCAHWDRHIITYSNIYWVFLTDLPYPNSPTRLYKTSLLVLHETKVAVCCKIQTKVAVCCKIQTKVAVCCKIETKVAVCCKIQTKVAVCCKIQTKVAVCCKIQTEVAVCCKIQTKVAVGCKIQAKLINAMCTAPCRIVEC